MEKAGSRQSLILEYEQHALAGSCLAATVKLGELLRISEREDSDSRQVVEGEIRALMRDDVLERAGVEAAAAASRAMHILSIGSKFTWDELVLVLTTRSELELAAAILELYGVDTSLLRRSALDTELREVAQSKANRKDFVGALHAVRRNWGDWVDDVWTVALPDA